MFDTILVALNTDEDCSNVFEQALDQAKLTGAVLKLLGVITPANDDTIPLAAYYPEAAGYPLSVSDEIWESCRKRYIAYKERSKAVLARFAKQAAEAGVQAEVIQVENTPGRAICDRAESESADLIMVGSHGRKGLSEIFMGSVSNYVVHHAPCSVLIVHTPPNNQEQSETAEATGLAAISWPGHLWSDVPSTSFCWDSEGRLFLAEGDWVRREGEGGWIVFQQAALSTEGMYQYETPRMTPPEQLCNWEPGQEAT